MDVGERASTGETKKPLCISIHGCGVISCYCGLLVGWLAYAIENKYVIK